MEHREVRVAAVMTAPRYETVWARNGIERALNGAGIPLTISGGVYYGQCMQRMLESLCKQDVEYALTVDFDSVFTAGHVQRLLSIVVQEDLDALAAIQPMRGKGRVLGSTGNPEQLEWTGRPLQVKTAHFGLTVLSIEKLRNVPKPWFVSTPDPNGEWSDDRTDDDVHFWHQWEAAGNTVHIDPGCRLGHMEEMITVFDDQMKLQHIYPKDWDKACESAVD